MGWVWDFLYTRADGKEKTMGPYPTEDKAREEMSKMLSYGAVCTGPYKREGEMPKQDKIEQFKEYLQKELDILEEPGVNFHIFYQFLDLLIERVKLVVLNL